MNRRELTAQMPWTSTPREPRTKPTVIVPFALLLEEFDPPLPDGFELLPRPFGVSFAGLACSEPRLLELAYEQVTRRRVAPTATAETRLGDLPLASARTADHR